MDWITDKIAIGNYVDAQNLGLLKEHSIRSILALDTCFPADIYTDSNIRKREVVRMIDGKGNDISVLKKALSYLNDMVTYHSPVLVHCHAGRSRSAIVVAAYLIQTQSLSPDEALAFVGQKRDLAITKGIEQLLYFI